MSQTWDLTLLDDFAPDPIGGSGWLGARLWHFIVTDLDGVQVGEIAARQRKVRHAFNARAKTASCSLRLDDPLVDFILDGRALLKAYEGDTLRFVGPLATYEETSDGTGGSVALTFADPWTILIARLLGKTTTGYADGSAGSLKDKTLLVTNLLAAANAEGYTGIEIGDTVDTGSTSFVAFPPYKIAADAIAEVVNALDGPDIEVVPHEPTDVGGGDIQIATLDVKSAIGGSRPNAAWEYGTGKRNVASYSRRGDLTLLLNRGFALPPSSDAAGVVVTDDDATSIADYGLREGLVSTDVDVAQLRQALVDEHVRIRKNPRVIVTFQPVKVDSTTLGRVPEYGVDFALGDTVPFRAVSEAGVVRVNAFLRVYAVDWTIDDNGASLPSFTLTPE